MNFLWHGMYCFNLYWIDDYEYASWTGTAIADPIPSFNPPTHQSTTATTIATVRTTTIGAIAVSEIYWKLRREGKVKGKGNVRERVRIMERTLWRYLSMTNVPFDLQREPIAHGRSYWLMTYMTIAIMCAMKGRHKGHRLSLVVHCT